MKEEVLRKTQIRDMHEVGEIQRAQEQRVDEVAVQTLRENHETVQQFTSQLQQIKEPHPDPGPQFWQCPR